MTTAATPEHRPPDQGVPPDAHLPQARFYRLFSRLRPFRRLPTWARYALATVVVVAFYLLREALHPHLDTHPYTLLFPAVFAISFAFGYGTGFYATLLSAVLSTAPFTWSTNVPHLHADLGIWLAFILFILVGLACAGVVEALGAALDHLDGSVVALRRDSEHRKSIERALAESNQQLRQTFEMASVGVAVSGLDARWRRVNPQLCAMLGYTEEEMLSRTFLEMTHPDDEPYNRVLLARATAGEIPSYSMEKRFIRKDGSLLWVSLSVGVVRSPEGTPLYLISVIQDISQRKAAEEVLARDKDELSRLVEERTAALMRAWHDQHRAEEALLQGEKLQAIGQLAGGVAHDFNNLLQVVSAGAQLLKKPGLLEERRNTVLEGMIHAAQNARELTSRLLAFARRQPLQPEIFQLNDRLSGMVELLRRTLGNSIEVRTEFAPDLWPVRVDPSQLEVAVLNLAVNARDAMPGGGRLLIRTRNTTLDQSTGQRGDFAALTIQDTGEGMAPSVLARIFEPFFTTKGPEKGTGLGLAQVHGFVRQSGGAVAVDSEPGGGTAFTLRLPRATPADQVAPLDGHGEPQRRELGQMIQRASGRRVLIVEDNVEVADFAQALLEDLGYETCLAYDAAEALSALEREGPVDAVFSNIVLPGVMDGVQLVECVRKRHPEMAVVLASGYHAAASGLAVDLPVEVLQKPYVIDQLGQALERALDAVSSRIAPAPPSSS